MINYLGHVTFAALGRFHACLTVLPSENGRDESSHKIRLFEFVSEPCLARYGKFQAAGRVAS